MRIDRKRRRDFNAPSRRVTMLPPFIIEQIRKREQDSEQAQQEQPRLELPIPGPREPRRPASEEDAKRGVIILEL